MRSRHIIKRGTRYQFMCRVPVDLLHLFPHSKLYKTLRTSDEKEANTLASLLEFQTQKLFFQLRTGMLDPIIQKELITRYLHDVIEFTEYDVNGNVPEPKKTGNKKTDSDRKKYVDRKSLALEALDRVRSQKGMGRENVESANKWSENIKTDLDNSRISLALRKTDSDLIWELVEARIYNYNKHVKKKKDEITPLSEEESKNLYFEFLKANIQALEVKYAASFGDMNPLRELKKSVQNDFESISKNKVLFSEVINDYKKSYIVSKPDVKKGTISDMEVECDMLLDIIGDISILDINTMKTIDKVKSILSRYPRNKKQIYGNKSIHVIIKNNRNYALISPKTANEPLKRLKNIINYAIKADMIHTANKIDSDEFFKVDRNDKPRKSYDKYDVERLVDALCTKPLWKNKPPRDDRFWVILIALFHGFRLGNIVNLTKKHIVNDEDDWPCFDLRLFKEEKLLKTINASMFVPIHEGLLLIGFIEWVNNQKGKRLFTDTTGTFGHWYNRREERYLGFESRYVTHDPDKCLHSTRHYFSNDLRKSGIDYKMIKEMMGHSRVKDDVTSAYYLDRTETPLMREVLSKMQLAGIDLDRLETRAKELFDLVL